MKLSSKIMYVRSLGRMHDEMRPVSIETNIFVNKPTSCLIKCGNTHIICSATIEAKVPAFLQKKNQGWISAEYAMLPCSTNDRMRREATVGKISGRTHEIQRLIGRSLRSITDLKALGERQILIDCDVINADGSTRTTAITGSYVALALAIESLIERKILKTNPIINQIAAISCGIYNDQIIVDLDYQEDSGASVDANFILTNNNRIVEIQAGAEQNPFSTEQMFKMLNMAQERMTTLFQIQSDALLS
jgi:ribonuclease PH